MCRLVIEPDVSSEPDVGCRTSEICKDRRELNRPLRSTKADKEIDKKSIFSWRLARRKGCHGLRPRKLSPSEFILIGKRYMHHSAKRKASLWTAKSAVQRNLTVPVFVCLGRAKRAVDRTLNLER